MQHAHTYTVSLLGIPLVCVNIHLWPDSALKIDFQKCWPFQRLSLCSAQSLSISQLEIENTGHFPEHLYPICKADRAQII